MPAKGRYFLNEGEEDPDEHALYEKYRLTSQHGPLLLTLLLVAIAACVALIVITFSQGDPSRNPAVLGTVFLMLAVFVALYVLVYVECLVRRWLRASALLIWACLVTLGYVLVFDSWRKAACAWQQVPFFLFVVFVVYTLLPFSMQGAIMVGVISSTSHLLVLGTVMEIFTKPSVSVGLQLLAVAVVFLCVNLTGAFHKHQMQDASRDLFTYTVKCIQIRRKLRIEKRQQENLLLSVLPAHISMGMKLAIIEKLKERGDRRCVPDNNFHSLYVKRHQNVRGYSILRERAAQVNCSPAPSLRPRLSAVTDAGLLPPVRAADGPELPESGAGRSGASCCSDFPASLQLPEPQCARLENGLLQGQCEDGTCWARSLAQGASRRIFPGGSSEVCAKVGTWMQERSRESEVQVRSTCDGPGGLRGDGRWVGLQGRCGLCSWLCFALV
uniref:Adenylate cyclase 7 n=1 Tax=Equus caballus TaxID=9796 RepID=A0A9L0S226_HORSE